MRKYNCIVFVITLSRSVILIDQSISLVMRKAKPCYIERFQLLQQAADKKKLKKQQSSMPYLRQT